MVRDKGNVLSKSRNESCIMCSNSKDRAKMKDSDGYCSLVKGKDGLPLRCVGQWGQKKVFTLAKYFRQVGVALKEREINYIEICSGPGLCIDFRSGDEFDGSPLAILKSEEAKNYDHLFFFDHDERTLEILRERIKRSTDISQEVKEKTIITIGDYNEVEAIIDIIKLASPHPWLNLVFIDPTDLSVPAPLLVSLTSFCQRTDFIINFVDGIDLKRNIVLAVSSESSKARVKYSNALAIGSDYFEDIETLSQAGNHDIVRLAERYADEYFKPLRDRGYEYIFETPILHYYKLYLLSRNDLGRKFWKNATAKTIEEAELSQGLLFGYQGS